MTNNSPIFQPADRIAQFKPYYFVSLGKKIANLKASGVEVIRIDMGSPDMPPPQFIIEAMLQAAARGDMHSYAPIGAPPNFREAVAHYYSRRFEVDLDPKTEIVGLIGSKEGLFHIHQVLINPGDIVLVPDPGYPVYTAACKIAGGQPYCMPLLPENNYFPDFNAIPAEVARKAKIMWLNYPNNPTGATATLEFSKKLSRSRATIPLFSRMMRLTPISLSMVTALPVFCR
jgi:LL-diaminopimelate aminotransferase